MNTRHLTAADLRGLRWRGLVRESSEAQAEKWSPERQRSDLRRAADDLGLIETEPLFYERTGSGEDEGVPELRAALADARRYDVLLVLHTSRFARNRAEAVTLKRDFRRAGIVIYFVAQRLLSGSRADALTEGLNELIDENENATRAMWIAGGMRERQLAGSWIGRIPFGYRRRMADFPDGTRRWDGGLEEDPFEAAGVRLAFERRHADPHAIARALNSLGFLTRMGRPFTARAVRSMLANPVYRGVLVRYRRSDANHYFDEADRRDGRQEIGRPFPALV